MLTTEQIKALDKQDGYEKLFIKCNLKPQDLLGLSPHKIEKITWRDNAQKLFVHSKLKPQDLIKFTDDGIDFILNDGYKLKKIKSLIDTPPESLLTPAYLASIHQQDAAPEAPHTDTPAIGADAADNVDSE